MRKPGSPAFSMIEVAIAIAVIAILAGAVAPLALKALNQAREQKTREVVQTAYEAMVGSRSRTVANMRADFGFTPPNALGDLRFMTTINPAANYRNGVVPLAYPRTFQNTTWGWNGPYWTGSTDGNGAPLDAWGRALRWSGNQVQSRGVDGAWGTTDDIVFPNPAAAIPTTTLTVTIQRFLPPPSATPASVTLQVTVYDRNRNATQTRTGTSVTFSGSGSQSGGSFTVCPGPISLSLRSVPVNATYSQDQVITLKPGENATVVFQTNS